MTHFYKCTHLISPNLTLPMKGRNPCEGEAHIWGRQSPGVQGNRQPLHQPVTGLLVVGRCDNGGVQAYGTGNWVWENQITGKQTGCTNDITITELEQLIPKTSVKQTFKCIETLSTHFFCKCWIPSFRNSQRKEPTPDLKISPLYIYILRITSRSSIRKEHEQNVTVNTTMTMVLFPYKHRGRSK